MSEAASGLSEEVDRGVRTRRLTVIRQHEWVKVSRLHLSEMMEEKAAREETNLMSVFYFALNNNHNDHHFKIAFG